MEILNLRICNFLTIGDSKDLRLNGQGLVLIQGKNEDDPSATSNGAGKSSIPDALCWALYGETARGESGDAVINDKVGKNCVVMVDLKDGDSVYRIARHRKHATHKNTVRVGVWNPASNYPTGTVVDCTRGTDKETQALIEQVMGCTLDVFKAAIYAGQEDMVDLPSMSDKELKLIVEQAAGISRLERAYEIARAKESETRTKLVSKDATLQALNASLVSAKSILLTSEQARDVFEASRPERQKQHQERASAVAASMKASHEALKAIPSKALQAELTDLNGKLASHRELQAKLQERREAIRIHEHQLAGYDGDLRRALADREKIQKHIDEAPNSIGKPCRECGKPHTAEDLKTVNANLAAQLLDAIVLAKARAADVKRVRDRLEVAKVAYDEFASTIPDVTTTAARVMEINAKLLEVERMTRAIVAAKNDYDAHNRAADQVLKDTNPHTSAVDAATRQIAQIDEGIKRAQADKELLDAELALREAVTKVFGPAGVRAHILDTVTPYLNERTSEYLNALSDGAISAVWSTLSTTTKGELREKFNIEVSNAKGGKSFGLISGGEKRKVRLAAMLALQDLVATRATKSINIWIGDEIDDALDPAGLERLMGILEKKARERGTVLVISHNELTDWIDNIVCVRKPAGQPSVVEGALCV